MWKITLTFIDKDVCDAYRMVDVRSRSRILPPLIFVLDGSEVSSLDHTIHCYSMEFGQSIRRRVMDLTRCQGLDAKVTTVEIKH